MYIAANSVLPHTGTSRRIRVSRIRPDAILRGFGARFPRRRRAFGSRAFGSLGDCSDPSIQAQITAEANAQGVPPAIALAVAQQESSCNQAARNSNPNGTTDIGMFQLNSATFPNTDPNDQAGNIHNGVSYLAQMFSRFGNWPQALAAYNGGPGGIAKPAPVRYSASVYNKAVNQWGLLNPPQPQPADSGQQSASSQPQDQSPQGIDWGSIALWGGIALGVGVLLLVVME